MELFSCGLSPADLRKCSPTCRRWRDELDPHERLPWRAALRNACPGIRVCDDPGRGGLRVQWPGVEVALAPLSAPIAEGQLAALPLATGERVDGGQGDAAGLEDWPSSVDYRALAHQLSDWRVGGALPVCPLCAGAAFYQGSMFTRSDIETGWHAYLLCGDAGSQASGAAHPLLTTLWANMGMPLDLGPPVVVQLRPLGERAEAEAEAEAEAARVAAFSGLWRGQRNPAALYILSIAVPCGHRLLLDGRPLAELGMAAFFCEQVGKYALTSRTRVGRYLDDQPAQVPRAHVFGAASVGRGGSWLPPGFLELASPAAPVEPCPFCGRAGQALLTSSLQLLPRDAGGEPQPFHGRLWACESGEHLWGWRARKVGVPVLED